ncbi:unannotated protein [freshwater metagenome]|uniref:Unannotated protein n=1 Tax=freshwater metagenome TaxID=449393 RepID=A0A6J7TT51_9ZZZZ
MKKVSCIVLAGWSAGMLSASKLSQPDSSSGPSSTAKPCSIKKSDTSFLIIEIGCNPPRCARLTGNVISTTSSSRTLRSRSASNRFVATASASATAAFASPINFPKLALSSAESAPKPREASAIGDLSPEWARRAVFSESKSVAFKKAARASSTHVVISEACMGVSLSGATLGSLHICKVIHNNRCRRRKI